MDMLTRLKKDFLNKHPSLTYFEQKEIFQYFDIAYCLGYDSINKNKGIKIIRSDGVRYNSIAEAARINKISERQIRRSLKGAMKAAGYNWKFLKT